MRLSPLSKALVVVTVLVCTWLLGACKVVDDVGVAAESALGARCNPSCGGMECGDDGCGGSCGSCHFGETCSGGQCACTPSCGGSRCGDDGCGGSCGSCGSNEECQHGSCVCVPRCGECGDDGCGGSCGVCPSGYTCMLNSCYCFPDCTGARCGDDGCGGSCGSCGDWEFCSAAGQCRPRPPVPPACSHMLSQQGVPLDPACNSCVQRVCNDKPSCCTLRWDRSCIQAADAICPGHD